MLVKRLECRVHSRAVARWRKVQEGAELPQHVSGPGGQGMALEAVSKEVTDVLWDSHHTKEVWFSLWLFLDPVIQRKDPFKMSGVGFVSFPCWMKQPPGTEQAVRKT